MIHEFQGEFRWLSNFWHCPFIYDGTRFSSVEQFYTYMKVQPEYRDQILACSSPGAAKRLARTLPNVHNWESRVKLDVMWIGLCNKFTQAEFRDKLLATGKEHLQEGNRWRDVFWGVELNGTTLAHGLNILGEMLMEIRKYLTDDVPLPEKTPERIVKKAGCSI